MTSFSSFDRLNFSFFFAWRNILSTTYAGVSLGINEMINEREIDDLLLSTNSAASSKSSIPAWSDFCLGIWELYIVVEESRKWVCLADDVWSDWSIMILLATLKTWIMECIQWMILRTKDYESIQVNDVIEVMKGSGAWYLTNEKKKRHEIIKADKWMVQDERRFLSKLPGF